MTRDERQILGVQKWMSAKGRGTLQWCTGVGKTRAALIAIKSYLTKNTDKIIVVIVPTEHLKMQWLKDLNKYNLIDFVSVEIINSAILKTTPIDFLILDEVHRMASNTFYTIFSNRPPKLVLGLSATFSRLDNRHVLLERYCPVVDVILASEAISNKWLSPYKEFKVTIYPDDIDVYRELNATFLNAFSYFNNDFDLAMKCVGGIKKGKIVIKPSHFVRYEYAQSLCTLSVHHSQYKSTVNSIFAEVTAMAFTWSKALQARKAYVMNHPLKIELARKILDKRPDKKAITFSATIKQAEKLSKKGEFIIHSKKTKKTNRISLEGFSLLKKGVIHTAKSLDEGADIDGLDLAVILCNTSSQTQKTQRIGRVIRYSENKVSEIFTLVIHGTMEENWYNTSTVGKEYIEISVEELDDILNGEESTNLVKEGKEIDQLFRF